MNGNFDAVMIGGGPAGLMAAFAAASAGAKVLLLDKNDIPGKKLRITGKGRCNLCNNCDEQEFLRRLRRGNPFLFSSIYGFSNADIMAFFESRGLPLTTERGNRVFPANGGANDVADVLIAAVTSAGATLKKGTAETVETGDKGVCGVKLKNGGRVGCAAVVVAAGGLSYPKTGSTGDGYRIAKALGHTVTATAGSLVPAECDGDMRALQGLSLRNAELVVKREKKELYRGRGELLFTHFGISGPLALTMSSCLAGEDLSAVECYIDLKPALSFEETDRRVLRDFGENKNRDFKNSLGALLPKTMIPAVVAESGIDPDKKINGVTAKERAALVRALKCFPLRLLRFRPVEEAVVTAGGVALHEINPRTMMSKRVPGLFFAGEVLDADGPTGGFNLGIAFSTGHCAGKAAAAFARGTAS